MTKNKMSPYLSKILKEMCRRVRTNFDSINFKKRDWYLKKEWTIKEEEKFNKWLVKYLSKNIKARQELMTIPSKSKIFLQKFVETFSFSYGWKIK